MSERRDTRYVVLGGGASGSSLVRALAARGVSGPVLLVDDGSVALDDRVWASWRSLSEPDDPAVSASWRRLAVATERGERELALVRHRYVAVRGRDLRAATDTALAAMGGARLTARALAVREDAR
ncbi:MAG TPA: lycopene cyclase family protein, partial [Candidatus Nanopelagicales bacterium]